MKKISVMILMLGLIATTAGCGSIEKETKEEAEPRVELLYEAPKFGHEFNGWDYEYDFDFDGKKEKINIDITDSADTHSQNINLTVGDYKKTLEGVEYINLLAVYACDISMDDGFKDLAIFTEELSADPRVQILKYNEELKAYSFISVDYDGEVSEKPCLWLGYADAYMDIDSDGNILLREQTNSRGMWDVLRKHYLDDEGRIAEEKQENYTVLTDYMAEPGDWMEFSDEKEEEMWKKGYMRANTDFAGNVIDIEEGDYFKVLLDDDDNNLFIRKENGEEGWINIDTDDYMDTISLNDKFFMMAG